MRLLVIIFTTILTVGCAGPTIKMNIPELADSSSVVIADLRPAIEKESETFSFSITSESYALYRRGDDVLDPNPIRLFQHRVYQKYVGKGAIPEVKVHHLVVYMNMQSQFRRSAVGSGIGGAIGAAISSGTQKYGVDGSAKKITQEEFEAFEKEYKRAFYSEQENPSKASVYKVYLEAEIDGKRTFVSTMTPLVIPDSKVNPHAVALETAIAYLLDQY